LRAGQLYVTDPSTRYCVQLLNPQPGERVLDACAAPGGKSCAMIAATLGKINLLATDAEPHRLPQLRVNLMRAEGEQVEVQLHDWSRPCPEPWQGVFDAVLLDVPCSNSGVLQRRVDARWRLQPAEFDRLSQLQLQILTCAAAAVRPGGRLVYSTCSIDRQENRSVVETFLSLHPDFSLAEDYLALPHREQADGAYAALLLRQPLS
jgi:16S rRNA (cytosine967-C5)-methyltransferase